jgi:hypothetical protein
MERGCLQRARARLDQQLPAKSGIRAAWRGVLKAAVLSHSARGRRIDISAHYCMLRAAKDARPVRRVLTNLPSARRNCRDVSSLP